MLESIGVDGLLKIAMPIEQTTGDQGDTEVAGALAMITTEDSEPA